MDTSVVSYPSYYSSASSNAPSSGRKDDQGKLRYDLLPTDALGELVRVYTLGAAKYTDRNWELGIKFSRVFAALMRHAWKWWSGERYAADDGQHHLASVAWCALALMHYDLNKKKYGDFDDRPKD